MRVFLLRMVAAKNSRKAARGLVAGGGDHARHQHAVGLDGLDTAFEFRLGFRPGEMGHEANADPAREGVFAGLVFVVLPIGLAFR
jgi:hypothetical protein